jgi:hypothetical protein
MSPSCQHGHFLSWISPASASVEARKIERDGAGRASAAGMVSSRCAPWGARRRRTVEGTQAPVRGWGSLRVRPVRRKGGESTPSIWIVEHPGVRRWGKASPSFLELIDAQAMLSSISERPRTLGDERVVHGTDMLRAIGCSVGV